MEKIICQRCGSIDDYTLSAAGPHQKATCNGCGMYIKFISQVKESAVQSKIIKHLEKAGWLVIKVIQCNLNGMTDLIALKNKRAVFIEVKRPGGKPEPLQLFRHEQLRQQGFEVIVADKIEDIIHL